MRRVKEIQWAQNSLFVLFLTFVHIFRLDWAVLLHIAITCNLTYKQQQDQNNSPTGPCVGPVRKNKLSVFVIIYKRQEMLSAKCCQIFIWGLISFSVADSSRLLMCRVTPRCKSKAQLCECGARCCWKRTCMLSKTFPGMWGEIRIK